MYCYKVIVTKLPISCWECITEKLSDMWLGEKTLHITPPPYLVVWWYEDNTTHDRTWHIPLPDGLGQVKLPARQVDFGRISFKSCIIGIEKCGIMEVGQVMIFTRGQFWPSGIVVACVCLCVCVCQSRGCPCDTSSVQARITKFWAEVQHTLVKIPIVLWDDWPWPSRSNLTVKPNFC